jgi:hypothetical protein
MIGEAAIRLRWDAVSTSAISQPVSQAPAREGPTLILAAKVPLAGVSGRIDHFTFDPKRRLTIFSGLGNNTIEIVNNFQGKRVKTIAGLNEPQGPLTFQAGPLPERSGCSRVRFPTLVSDVAAVRRRPDRAHAHLAALVALT